MGIVVAATNRADVLDPALLRPGRFDRQVSVDVPDSKGRLEILKVHAKNKRVNPEISLAEIAKRVPGFSGADLANLITRRPSSAGAATRTRSPPWRSTTRSTASWRSWRAPS